MKLSQKSGNQKASALGAIKHVCVACYQKALEQVARVKQNILAETRETLAANDRLVQLALNEAEAIVSRTNYPHLLFPTLALEKVHAVTAWNQRQTLINQRGLPIAA